MSKSRASKGLLVEPASEPNFSESRRKQWLDDASKNFVTPSNANQSYYRIILERLWPQGHGIPGPIVTEQELRDAIDAWRASSGKGPYKDVFRRVRELQGEEGFTSIVKEGTRYQLQSLIVGNKREPRAKPSPEAWKRIKERFDHSCAHCGAPEPTAQLSPDHRVPRSRGGPNDEENWQPLCEQCNILKSSSCQGCMQNCYTCTWAFPERYKPVTIDDSNKEQVRREAEKHNIHQSDLVNKILRSYFLGKK